MVADRESKPLSPAEYLEWEKHQAARHEYVGGRTEAMAGGTAAHNTIATNLTREIGLHLRAGQCRVFAADMKVEVDGDGPFFYPDVAVTCDRRDDDATYVIQRPCLIVEVLSPTTEEYDRSLKFVQYRRIAALQEYFLIDSQKFGVESFRRSSEAEQTWLLQIYQPESIIVFASIGLQLPATTIYEKVRF